MSTLNANLAVCEIALAQNVCGENFTQTVCQLHMQ